MAKSVEVKLNEAIAELKAKVSPTKFTEVSEKLHGFAPIADKLKLVEEALAATIPNEADTSFTGLLGRMDHEFTESRKDVGVLFGLEPRTVAPIKETVAPINKHNGVADNGGEEFRESASAANSRKDRFAGGDAILLEHMTDPITKQPITEEQKRKLRGDKPAAYASLTEQKKKDYDFARAIGLNESDSLRVATI